jgi:hypothetical protein
MCDEDWWKETRTAADWRIGEETGKGWQTFEDIGTI